MLEDFAENVSVTLPAYWQSDNFPPKVPTKNLFAGTSFNLIKQQDCLMKTEL